MQEVAKGLPLLKVAAVIIITLQLSLLFLREGMVEKYEGLYNEMLADISRCQEMEHPEKENVESCFWVARNYWQQLQAIVISKGFRNDEAEISFYRNVKPTFASHIEYFSLLAEGLSFIPAWVPLPEDLQGKIDEVAWFKTWQSTVTEYWVQEEKRGNRFYSRNQAFLEYCESGCTEHDEDYFLTRNRVGGEMSQRRSHNRETELFTIHEELLTSWGAYKLYSAYTKMKANEPVNL
jgi:hypothetical protein